MADLTQARQPIQKNLSGAIPLPQAASTEVFQGGAACIDIVTGTVKKMAAGNANLVRIGNFFESNNNTTTATQQVMVQLDHEVVCQWYNNATGAAAVVTLFTNCYGLDDQTVTVTSGTNSIAGRVWAIDTVKGVLVETTNL